MSTISNENVAKLAFELTASQRLGSAAAAALGIDESELRDVAHEINELLALRKERKKSEPVAWVPKSQLDLLKKFRIVEADMSSMQRFDEVPLYTAPPAPSIADDSLPYDPQIAEYEQMMEAEQAQADTTAQQFESLAGKAVGGWIPCSEQMPEVGEEVLMRISCNDHFNIESGKYKGDGLWLGCWFSTYGKKGSPYQVTHWMPIPAAPEPCK